MYLITRDALMRLLISLEANLARPDGEGGNEAEVALCKDLNKVLAAPSPEYETSLRIDERTESKGLGPWRPRLQSIEDGAGRILFDDTESGLKAAHSYLAALQEQQMPATGYRIARLHSVVTTVHTLLAYQPPKAPLHVPKSMAQWPLPKFLGMVHLAAAATLRDNELYIADVPGGGIKASCGSRVLQRTDGAVSWFIRNQLTGESIAGVNYGYVASRYDPVEWAAWLVGGAAPSYRDEDEEPETLEPSIIPAPTP